MLLTISYSFSQENDTTKIKIGSNSIIIVRDGDDEIKGVEAKNTSQKDKFEGHWAGIELGFNGYLDKDFSSKLSTDNQFLELNTNKSWSLSLNFAQKSIGIYKDKVGLITGLGFEFNNYRFNGNNRLISSSDTLSYIQDTVYNFKKSKLAVTYINVPLLLEWKIPVNEHTDYVHFAAGIIGGLKISSHTKYIYEKDNDDHKDKDYKDFHLSPFKYSLTARIGYEGLSIFANYALSSLFEKNEGPELYPYTVGFSLNF